MKTKKISISGFPAQLSGHLITKGEELGFSALDIKGNRINIKSINGFKVISVLPDINTPYCDFQTRNIIKLASENKDINFITISSNEPKVFREWVKLNKVGDEVLFLSDWKDNKFVKMSGLGVKESQTLFRAFVILDQNNKVIEIIRNKELGKDLNFSKLEKRIKWLNKEIQEITAL